MRFIKELGKALVDLLTPKYWLDLFLYITLSTKRCITVIVYFAILQICNYIQLNWIYLNLIMALMILTMLILFKSFEEKPINNW